MKFLFASANQGKIKEVHEIFSDLNFELFSLNDFNDLRAIGLEETGSTFQENAFLKAKFFADKTNLQAFSDDSGLVIEVLAGFPGIISGRWLRGTDTDRNKGILNKLKNESNRTAAFVTTVCLYNPHDQQTHYFEGKVEGEIAMQSSGSAGFGYDPIFIPKGYDKTFATLGLEIKNKLSHRSMALSKLRDFLSKDLG